MKDVDLLLILLLAAEPEQGWEFASIGRALGIGSATAHRAMDRVGRSGLVDVEARRVRPMAVEEFLFHGLKYVFPAELGAPSLGVPTAHSAPVMTRHVASGEDDLVVWPSVDGEVRGVSLRPIHASAPEAAMRSPALYDLLALCDVLRMGRAREVKIARDEIRERLAGVATA